MQVCWGAAWHYCKSFTRYWYQQCRNTVLRSYLVD